MGRAGAVLAAMCLLGASPAAGDNATNRLRALGLEEQRRAGSTLWVHESFGAEIPSCSHALLPPLRVDEENDHDDQDPRYADYDLRHVDLTLDLDFERSGIEGVVRFDFNSSRAGVDSLLLDLVDEMEVISVTREGRAVPYRHARRLLVLALDPPLADEEEASIEVRYRGTPVFDGFLGLQFQTHPGLSGEGIPVVQSLSETNAAPSWWPCKDVTHDKFSADVSLTVPEGYLATSNGILVASGPADTGRRFYHWRALTPLPSYLIAVTATNFVTWSDTYTPTSGAPGMPVRYYAYPEDETKARAVWARTPEMIAHFAGRFGEYPFTEEGYGMVEFNWGGAMEHQTLSSMGAFLFNADLYGNERVVAHELAHQWWGDLVTVGHWDDIWLQEGFATYGEVLWFEHAGGDSAYLAHLRTRVPPPGREFEGTLYRPTYTFNSTVYFKGAWVLHMLRYLLGDEPFFHALREYRRNLAVGTSGTELFRELLEQTTQRDLGGFFEAWVYGTGRPIYELFWTSAARDEGVDVDVRLRQIQREEPFAMPLELVAIFDNAPAETTTVESFERESAFRLHYSREPNRILLDPRDRVLKRVELLVGPAGIDEPATSPAPHLVAFGPNPTSGRTRFQLETPLRNRAVLHIVDATGRTVRRLEGDGSAVETTLEWDGLLNLGQHAPAGSYWILGTDQTVRLLVIR